MILLYRIVTNILYPFLIALIYFRKIIKKEDAKRFKEKIFKSSFNITRTTKNKLIWFHAASVGEAKSILPIILNLNKNKNLEFLITTVTLSSSNLILNEIKNYNNIHHHFFPLDIYFLINDFVKKWDPKAIFLVDSEIWPNLITCSKNNGIPISLINARITKKSFRRWLFLSDTAKKLFNIFDLCLVSNLETKDYLTRLNAKNIISKGNIKLISKLERINNEDENSKFFENKKFWCAISTHKGEENFCISVHSLLKKKYKDIVSLIAPRHLNRVNNLRNMCETQNMKYQILDKDEQIQPNAEIIIINSYGNLGKFLRFCKSAFIGKSLLSQLKRDAGQNPLEAAKFGCKIYHGPYVYNFIEIYNILRKYKISQEIYKEEELYNNLVNDFENGYEDKEKKIELMENLSQKTLTNTMKVVNELISNENK